MSNYAIAETESRLVVYLTKSRKIYRVPKRLRNELEDLCRSEGAGGALRTPALESVAEALCSPDTPLPKPMRDNQLRRVSVNVTNACNMACRYCYANEGEYGSPRGLMSPEMARKSIEVMFTHYDRIGVVQFFGGEPLMNVPAIEAACEKLSELYNAGRISYMPLLGLVTNGSVMNKHVERFLATYQPHVTVSFDGPPELTDEVRPLKSDKPSSPRILRNAPRIAELIGRPIGIEATWTKAQQDAGVTVEALVGYLRTTFHTDNVHVAPVTLPVGHPYRPCGHHDFADSVPAFTRQFLDGDRVTFSKYHGTMLAYMGRMGSDVFCDAGMGVLAVSGSGRVYPCFMFIDDEEYDSSVLDVDLFTSERFLDVLDRFVQASKAKSEQCGGCALRTVCAGCLGANRFETGDPFRVSDETCKLNFEFNHAMLIAADEVSSHVCSS